MTSSFNTELLFASLAGILFLAYFLSSLRAKRGLPPGPRGLPLIGNLHMLGTSPHRTLETMAKKYGPIMLLKLGFIPTIVVSSAEAAELFLKTHDTVFASRPKSQTGEYFGLDKDLVFAPYGDYWRSIRKLCTTELFSKIELFKPTRKEEIVELVESIKKAVESGSSTIIDVTDKVESLISNVTYRSISGVSDVGSNIRSTIKEAMEVAGTLNVSDCIPFLRPLDIQGLGRRMKAVEKIMDDFFERIIDVHARDAKELQGQHRDFIDIMLSKLEAHNTGELHLDQNNIKAIMFNILGASTDTSSTIIEWVIAELVKNPRVMKQVQDELENIVGLDRMVEEKDLVKLDYLNMVIKESMRLHPPLPLLIPHESVRDITLNGYFIPNKSKIIINVWAIGRDRNVWSDNAEDFYPERFIGTSLDVQGHHFQLLPFGSGRRKCPGIQLGLISVQLVVAQLLHCFTLELPNRMSPNDLNMKEKFGLSLPMENHLLIVPTYRLRVPSGV